MSRTLELIALEAGNRSLRSRRLTALAIAIASVGFATASMWAQRSTIARDKADGIFEAQTSIGDVRKAMGLWNPRDGYAQLSGQSYESTLGWGAVQRIEVLPGIGGERGIVLEILYANKAQCQGVLEATHGFFDHAFVDAKSIKMLDEPCSHMGQNALRFVKLDPRPLSLEMDALSQTPKTARKGTPAELANSAANGPGTPARPPAAAK